MPSKRQPIAWLTPPIFEMKPEQLHVTSRSATIRADQLSLIIPNASMHQPSQELRGFGAAGEPPTSSTVLLNLGKSREPAAPGFPLLTELEARLLPAMSFP